MTQVLYHLDVTSNADMLTSMISALLDVTLVALRPPFSHAHDTSTNTVASSEVLVNLLCEVFQSLDTDNDGYLTAADFSAQGTYTSQVHTHHDNIYTSKECTPLNIISKLLLHYSKRNQYAFISCVCDS